MAATNTFEMLAREWIEIRLQGWEPSTAKRTVSALELHVFPLFGKRLFTEILPIEWMNLFRSITVYETP